MRANEYQKLAARTINPNLSRGGVQHHALLGLPAEVGELTGIFQKNLQGHDIDDEHVMKEMGDVLWMLAELCTVRGYEMGDIMQKNIDKLIARFPNGFEVDKSLHRKEGDV